MRKLSTTVAAMPLEGGVDLNEISYPVLRDRLLVDGQVLTVPE